MLCDSWHLPGCTPWPLPHYSWSLWKLFSPAGRELHSLHFCGFSGTGEAAALVWLLFSLRERLQGCRKWGEGGAKWWLSECLKMVQHLLGQCQHCLFHRGPLCSAHLALTQGMKNSWLQVFHYETAETILTLSTLKYPGPGVAETLDSSPSYTQLNAKEIMKGTNPDTINPSHFLAPICPVAVSQSFRALLCSVFAGLPSHLPCPSSFQLAVSRKSLFLVTDYPEASDESLWSLDSHLGNKQSHEVKCFHRAPGLDPSCFKEIPFLGGWFAKKSKLRHKDQCPFSAATNADWMFSISLSVCVSFSICGGRQQ